VGLIAALLIALDPNMWMSNEFVGAESIEPLVVAAVVFCTYRFWKRPDVPRAIWLGVVLGLTMLCRDELALLVLFVFVPMCLLARALTWQRRFALLGVGLGAIVLVIGPWAGYNLSRFDKPTFLSDGAGITMASADCPDTFSGQFEGYWSMRCALDDAKTIPKRDDESTQGALFEHAAVSYMQHHEGRVVPVTLAKLGRAFGFFHPMQQISFDSFLETRPHRSALVGLAMYYALLVLSVGGTVILRRRRIPVYPLWAIGVNVALAVIVTFGTTRYRLPFDVALVLMGSVALAWAWDRIRPERRPAAPAGEGPGDADAPSVDEPVLAHV
jgi:4-amino-4-deoxy-L-arabinose transferase-like glycosyltransferase